MPSEPCAPTSLGRPVSPHLTAAPAVSAVPRVGLSSLPGLRTEPVTVLGPMRGLHMHLPARGHAWSTCRNSQMAGPACRPFWEPLPSLLEPRKPISQTPRALVHSLPLVPTCVFQCCQHPPYNPTKVITQLVQGEAKAQPENLRVSRNFSDAVSCLRGHAASGLMAESLASGQRGRSRTWSLSEQRWKLNSASNQ